jgi:hypothetical protein
MWLLYEAPDTKFENLASRFMDIRKRVNELPTDMARLAFRFSLWGEGGRLPLPAPRSGRRAAPAQRSPSRSRAAPLPPRQGKMAYFVAIPTTSGTGSEVTPFSVITDEVTHQKCAPCPLRTLRGRVRPQCRRRRTASRSPGARLPARC